MPKGIPRASSRGESANVGSPSDTLATRQEAVRKSGLFESKKAGQSDGRSLTRGEYVAEQTLSVPGSRFSELKEEDKGFSTKSNETTGRVAASASWGSVEGMGEVREADEKVGPVVGSDMFIGYDVSQSNGIFPNNTRGGYEIEDQEGTLKEGDSAGFAEGNEKIDYKVDEGTDGYGKGLRNFFFSQVGVGKGGATLGHEKDKKSSSDIGMGTFEYREGREFEPSRSHDKEESDPSKVEQEMPRQSSALWISAATFDIDADEVERHLRGKQAAVAGGGTCGEGAATNVTPNVVAEKDEHSEKLSSNMDSIEERCDVDVEVHQSESSSEHGKKRGDKSGDECAYKHADRRREEHRIELDFDSQAAEPDTTRPMDSIGVAAAAVTNASASNTAPTIKTAPSLKSQKKHKKKKYEDDATSSEEEQEGDDRKPAAIVNSPLVVNPPTIANLPPAINPNGKALHLPLDEEMKCHIHEELFSKLIERGAVEGVLDASKDQAVQRLEIGAVVHDGPYKVLEFILGDASKGVFRRKTLAEYRDGNERHRVVFWQLFLKGNCLS